MSPKAGFHGACLAFALVPTAAWVGSEPNEKLGLPKNADAIHETYLPVTADKTFAATLKQE